MNFILPWPPSSLSPNTRSHWSALARAKKSYRYACAMTAREQGATKLTAKKLHVTLVFVPPTRRAFDIDNCLSRMKAGLDGLAEVLCVDDKHWSLTISKADEVGGMVRVTVEEIA